MNYSKYHDLFVMPLLQVRERRPGRAMLSGLFPHDVEGFCSPPNCAWLLENKKYFIIQWGIYYSVGNYIIQWRIILFSGEIIKF
jgi:hypothetical protein